MRNCYLFLLILLMVSCVQKNEKKPFSQVHVKTLFEDSVSIRAIEIMGANLAFAGSNGVFGSIDLATEKVRVNKQVYDTVVPEFRSVAHTKSDFFMLSVANPALLYKTGSNGKMELVYIEEDEHVFYDAMTFWNDTEGVAVGDSMNGCLSIIITRDGGTTWKKLPCNVLPKGKVSEGAFAASNTNIKIIGLQTWIATTTGVIYYSPDKGKSWTVQQTPIISDKDTEGIYSIDFYNEKIGFAIGGDYTKPEGNIGNKAITMDGGTTWQLIASGVNPQYKSCVQFVPNSGGEQIVALGFTGISYSSDAGTTWAELSNEPFYTVRFYNDSIAYAAGKNRIAKLMFK